MSACTGCAVWVRSKHLSLLLSCFPSECIIKSLINPRNVTKMESTFGTWMKDTARLNDERIWVAEHFSGRLLQRTLSTGTERSSQGSLRSSAIFFQQLAVNVLLFLLQVGW